MSVSSVVSVEFEPAVGIFLLKFFFFLSSRRNSGVQKNWLIPINGKSNRDLLYMNKGDVMRGHINSRRNVKDILTELEESHREVSDEVAMVPFADALLQSIRVLARLRELAHEVILEAEVTRERPRYLN